MKTESEFWTSMNCQLPCWLWNGYGNNKGYGQVCWRGQKGVSVHRLAYTLTYGKIRDGLQVQHLCNNRRCCNPNHLTIGTNRENSEYATRCGRIKTKLTADQVVMIRNLIARGVHQKTIASMFGVNTSNISYIKNKTWKHVESTVKP